MGKEQDDRHRQADDRPTQPQKPRSADEYGTGELTSPELTAVNLFSSDLATKISVAPLSEDGVAAFTSKFISSLRSNSPLSQERLVKLSLEKLKTQGLIFDSATKKYKFAVYQSKFL
jgi:hypothetical protein